MNKFSQTSEARLKTCHRDLQVLFAHVIQDYDCTIVCGNRNKEDQNNAVECGKSKLLWPKSSHNYMPSLAVDAVAYEKNGIDWSKTQSAYFAGYVKATADRLFRIGTISHRIKTGVDWNNDNDIDDTKFWDGPHFELIPNEGEKFNKPI